MSDREIFTASDLCLDMSIFRNSGEEEAVYDILKIDRENGRIWLTEFLSQSSVCCLDRLGSWPVER